MYLGTGDFFTETNLSKMKPSLFIVRSISSKDFYVVFKYGFEFTFNSCYWIYSILFSM